MIQRAMRLLLIVAFAACTRHADTDSPVDTDVVDTTDTSDTDVVGWPPCEHASTFVTWTRDDGATLAPVDVGPTTNTYTLGIAVITDDSNVLWAEHGGTVWESNDVGCTWTDRGTVSGTGYRMYAAESGLVWGYQENGTSILRIAGETVDDLPFGESILGMGTDPTGPDHVRIGTASALWETTDRGDHWTMIASLPDGSYAYTWAFDPTDIDRIAVGLMVDGIRTTHDGGQSWTKAGGFDDASNVFTVAWSPADTDVVWAEGLDIVESDANVPSGGRHVWRSTDGAASFDPVVDQSVDVTLSNGVPMTPDAVDADVVRFTWGSSFQGEGTHVYRYDHATGQVVDHHNPWHRVTAMTHSPADPSLIYFAIVHEEIQ